MNNDFLRITDEDMDAVRNDPGLRRQLDDAKNDPDLMKGMPRQDSEGQIRRQLRERMDADMQHQLDEVKNDPDLKRALDEVRRDPDLWRQMADLRRSHGMGPDSRSMESRCSDLRP